MIKKHFLNFLIIFFLGGITILHAQTQPKFSIVPTTPTDVLILRNDTTTVQYRVTNNTKITRTLVMTPIAGITPDTNGAGFCSNPFTLAPNESCLLTLPIVPQTLQKNAIVGGPVVCKTKSATNNSPNPLLCSQPAQADILRVLLIDFITVNPGSLTFVANSTGTVTVSNLETSVLGIRNLTAAIPPSSNIFIAENNCPSVLAPGASCTITFGSSVGEGPTTVAISGDNSNTVNVDITVSSEAIIAISSPVQSARIVDVGSGTLEIVVTNDPASPSSVSNVTGLSNCIQVSVNDVDCQTTLAPGDSCTLSLVSSVAQIPCDLTISATGASNTITTQIAFRYLSGIVFESSFGVTGKVVREDQFDSGWAVLNSQIPGAMSPTDGEANTNAIVSSLCLGNPSACAASRCRNLGAAWYLPAYMELSDVFSILCSSSGQPCTFGGFSGVYWSSTYFPDFRAYTVSAPQNILGNAEETTTQHVRCIREFP